jgi:hypothetical protein
MVNSEFGITLLFVMPISFRVMDQVDTNTTQTKKIIPLSSLHHHSTQVTAKILKPSNQGDDAFLFQQARGHQNSASTIDFDGIVSFVCSPEVVCTETDDTETRQWQLHVSTMNAALIEDWSEADKKIELEKLPKIKPQWESHFF